MKNENLFKSIKNRLMELRLASVRNSTPLSDLDYGIAYIGFLIAALDGNISDDELSFLREFAVACDFPIEDPKSRRSIASLLRNAGGLALMARMPAFSEEERIAAFVDAVGTGLPHGFAGGSRDDLTFAFTFWTALAMTDGDFSPIERKAIEILKGIFDNARALKRNTDMFVTRQVAAMTPDYDKTLKGLAGEREPSLLGEDFTARAEEMLLKIGLDGEQGA